ncbi:hypothetical protein LCGC14_1192070 [marine sediment metagenome]|uniref:Uncharacterized protein n=1 Tax=marine sediment metagenome TaxID=412755 RepID=A0A0F9PPE9_9ZZZZ
MSYPKCGRDNGIFDVVLERKGFRDEFVHTLCCICGAVVRG